MKLKDFFTLASLFPPFAGLPGRKPSAAMEAKGWQLIELEPEVPFPGPPVYRCKIINPQGEEVQPWNREYLAAIREARQEVRHGQNGPTQSP